MNAGAEPTGSWRWLTRRWFFAAVVALGTLLALPSLSAGFIADDYIFINRLEQTEPPPIWQLYEFADGAPGQHERMMETRWVAFPWWVASDFKVRFARPVSSALFALDHALFGHSPVGYHVHGLLWGVLLLISVGLLLRAACPEPVWRVAFLLYAVCGSRAESVGWVSSRHMLVSTVPALFGLWAMITRQESPHPAARFALGCIGMALGLLGGEAALSVVCFWLAFELVGPRAGGRRMSALAPLVLMATYALCYKLGGYGAAGSSAYLDPISAPITFLRALPERLAILLAEAWVGLPSGLATTTMPAVGALVGAIATLFVGLLLSRVWPELEPGERRAIAWLGGGASLALVVNAGAFLGPRLLLIPGLATFVVLATLLLRGFRALKAAKPLALLGGKLLLWLLILVHAVLAPILLAANCALLGKLGGSTLETDRTLDVHFAQHRGTTPPLVYLVNGSDPFVSFYVAATRAMRLPESTGQWTVLSLARATHHITRTGPAGLRIEIAPGMLHATFEGLFRRPDAPLVTGTRAPVAGGYVTVLETRDGHPTAIGLTLASGTFDDDEHCLLSWRDGRLVPLDLAIGASASIPWSPGPSGLL